MWVADYNYQVPWAHRQRPEGQRIPAEVLGWVHGKAHPLEQLDRLFAARVRRRLDRHGCLRFRHWRLYGERGLPKQPVAVWLAPETLTVSFHDEVLTQYGIRMTRDGAGLADVTQPQVFPTRYQSPQALLWEPEPNEWLLVMRLPVPVRRPRRRRVDRQAALLTDQLTVYPPT